jgi:hypothetical protein
VIQLPVVQQEANECGINTLAITDRLCTLRQDGRNASTCFTSDNFKRQVGRYRIELSRERAKDKTTWMSFEEMHKFNGNSLCDKVGDLHRTLVVLDGFDDDLTRYEQIRDAQIRWRRGGDNPQPEVFSVFLAKKEHYVSIRIERMPNGMVVVLLADSKSYKVVKGFSMMLDKQELKVEDEIERLDRIVDYEKLLAPLVRLFV